MYDEQFRIMEKLKQIGYDEVQLVISEFSGEQVARIFADNKPVYKKTLKRSDYE